jgi:hypothetical protein
MCKKFICGVSTLAILMAIVLGAYGYTSVNGQKYTPEAGEYKTEFTVDKSMVAAVFCLLGCIFGIVIGLLGLCLCKFPNPCAALIFGALAFISGIIAFIAGGAVLSGGVKDSLYQEACVTPQKENDGRTGKEIAEKEYGSFIDNLMCTETCPCDKDSYDAGYKNLPAGFWKERDAPSGKSFKSGGYKTWLKCYEEVLSKATKDGKNCQANDKECVKGVDGKNKDFKNFIKDGGVDFIRGLETEFNCASACTVPQFYIARPLSEGIPTKDCVTAMSEELGDNTGAGAVAVVTGLVLLVASFGAIPLCSGYNELKEE